jgi:hypothetical protein
MHYRPIPLEFRGVIAGSSRESGNKIGRTGVDLRYLAQMCVCWRTQSALLSLTKPTQVIDSTSPLTLAQGLLFSSPDTPLEETP